MTGQPKWFTDLQAKDRAGEQKAEAVESEIKGSVEDRITVLEQLLETHGIRPKT